jgi:dihydropteroate synthase|tara:strand:- start:16749 stop:17579 length:831 start_codon:yes stop_codon:yes gene_type:complete
VKRTVNCKGNLIDLSIPKVMGILNFTPDSFYSESRALEDKALLDKIELMVLEGATFIDIGAYSSRPGAAFVSQEEEKKRLLPSLELLIKEFPELLISVDTFRSAIASEAIDIGACMVNDISAGNLDQDMFALIAQKQVPYILMHMRGTPKTMSSLNNYDNLILDTITELQQKVNTLTNLGVNDLILDPGLGFSKDLKQNYEIVKHLKSFETLGHPILIGASRKSMIYKALSILPEEALNGSTVIHTASLLNGASILRVHDVKAAVEAVKITNLLKN